MGLTTLPTSIGGIQLPFDQIEGPLASLFSSDAVQNLTYPSDLVTNPTMCHAVQFSVHDWTTELGTTLGSLLNSPQQMTEAAKKLFSGDLSGAAESSMDVIPNALKLVSSQTYKQQLGRALAHINLYMPDTLVNNINNSYDAIGLTQKLGKTGMALNAAQDVFGSIDSLNKDTIKNMVNAYTTTNVGDILSKENIQKALNNKSMQGLTAGITDSDLLSNAFGVAVNPQVQMLYRGTDLRQFTLEFVFTPKNAIEARTTKKIIDAFNYFSLPSKAGETGQFLVAPQIFMIKFSFSGSNGIGGALSNAFQQAFSSIGLGFLNTTDQTSSITTSPNAKMFQITSPCVLENVSTDYAPLGTWATYADGYPIQTRLTLNFRETQMQTKESYSGNMDKKWLSDLKKNTMSSGQPSVQGNPDYYWDI